MRPPNRLNRRLVVIHFSHFKINMGTMIYSFCISNRRHQHLYSHILHDSSLCGLSPGVHSSSRVPILGFPVGLPMHPFIHPPMCPAIRPYVHLVATSISVVCVAAMQGFEIYTEVRRASLGNYISKTPSLCEGGSPLEENRGDPANHSCIP